MTYIEQFINFYNEKLKMDISNFHFYIEFYDEIDITDLRKVVNFRSYYYKTEMIMVNDVVKGEFPKLIDELVKMEIPFQIDFHDEEEYIWLNEMIDYHYCWLGVDGVLKVKEFTNIPDPDSIYYIFDIVKHDQEIVNAMNRYKVLNV